MLMKKASLEQNITTKRFLVSRNDNIETNKYPNTTNLSNLTKLLIGCFVLNSN
jgi:hypothetical protein